MKVVDAFWSMNNPYCYFALNGILTLREWADDDVRLRMVLPGILHNAGRFKDAEPIEQWYFDTDSVRTATFLDIPYA